MSNTTYAVTFHEMCNLEYSELWVTGEKFETLKNSCENQEGNKVLCPLCYCAVVWCYQSPLILILLMILMVTLMLNLCYLTLMLSLCWRFVHTVYMLSLNLHLLGSGWSPLGNKWWWSLPANIFLLWTCLSNTTFAIKWFQSP